MSRLLISAFADAAQPVSNIKLMQIQYKCKHIARLLNRSTRKKVIFSQRLSNITYMHGGMMPPGQ